MLGFFVIWHVIFYAGVSFEARSQLVVFGRMMEAKTGNKTKPVEMVFEWFLKNNISKGTAFILQGV